MSLSYYTFTGQDQSSGKERTIQVEAESTPQATSIARKQGLFCPRLTQIVTDADPLFEVITESEPAIPIYRAHRAKSKTETEALDAIAQSFFLQHPIVSISLGILGGLVAFSVFVMILRLVFFAFLSLRG